MFHVGCSALFVFSFSAIASSFLSRCSGSFTGRKIKKRERKNKRKKKKKRGGKITWPYPTLPNGPIPIPIPINTY
jgi:hypothetical protein